MPNKITLKKYADILIKCALWSGKGIKPGEAVFLSVPEVAKPILEPLVSSVLEAGGYPITQFIPDGVDRVFFEYANDDQLKYSPRNQNLGRVIDATHFVSIIAEKDPHELDGIDSAKIMTRNKAMKYYMDARNEKEEAGKLTWTLALFGTEAMAKEAGMSLEEYWQEIIKACFLDFDNPVGKWQEIFDQVSNYKEELDALNIEKLHVKGENVDLEIKLGKDRKWLGGSGRNIPSFELFISPDWRGTNGWIRFNQPLYRYGSIIKDIYLRFENGVVVEATASQNEKLLTDMIAVEGADKIGEFSLTDKRFSRITKFMATTLFDENVGGEFGNTHIALGRAYKDSYAGDPSKLTTEDWIKMGYNDSAIHTDIISTANRTVTATLLDGSEKVIYKDGEFVLD